MSSTKSGKTGVMILLTSEQMDKLNEAWKSDKKAMNRSQYIKDALNTHSGMKIF